MRKARTIKSNSDHAFSTTLCSPKTQPQPNEQEHLFSENDIPQEITKSNFSKEHRRLQIFCQHVRQERDMLKSAMYAFWQSIPASLSDILP